MSIRNDLQKLYIGYLGRAADLAGLDYWEAQINAGAITLDDLRINWVNEQPEYAAMYGQLTRAQTAGKIYENLFKRAPDEAGLEYWVSGEGAAVPVDQLIMAFMAGAQGTDVLELDNQVEVAHYYTENIELYSIDTARNILKLVSFEANSVAAAKAQVDAWNASGIDGKSFTLTTGQDTLFGTGADDVFNAPIVQNQLGAVTNTFESGDYLDGMGGTNALYADLTQTVTGTQPFGPAISATTKNIQEVYFRAQYPQDDTLVQGFTIDAEKMSGVQQWWSQNSRADILIEDVRENPSNVAIGMRQTDPGVSYLVDFNPLWIFGEVTEDESFLTITLQEITTGQDPAATELANMTLRAIDLTFNGEQYTLATEAMSAANTWAELEAALADALAGIEALEGLTVEHRGDGVFVITDPEGGTFMVDPEALDVRFSGIDVRNRIEVGEPVPVEALTNTTVVLDAAGNGSQGGVLDIGAMSGLRGVEVFDVLVDRTSHLETMQSAQQVLAAQYLQEVYVSHLDGGAGGNFYLGDRSIDAQGFATTTDNRLDGLNGLNGTWGLTDVRVFDASGFEGEIKLGAQLTGDSVDRYLDPADDVVEFKYFMGDGNSNLSIDVNNPLSRDSDFQLTILGGAGNDRFNLTNSGAGATWKNSTYIDGADGENTVEVQSSTGILPGLEDAFAQFDNIQTLVVAGNNATVQDVVDGNMQGLENIIVATGNVNTTLRQVDLDETSVTISGKNQTLAAGNSNNNQNIGVVSLLGSSGTDASVLLDNTARLDGVLTVNRLTVDDFGQIQSQVRNLTVESDGNRETVNIVQNFDGPRVTTLNFEGSQSLGFHVNTMATLPPGPPTPALEISGAGMDEGASLGLGLNAANLQRGNLDVVEGTAGDDDLLALYGQLAGTQNPTVRDFEDIQFGWLANTEIAGAFGQTAAFTGTYDAANTTGVDAYTIGSLAGAFSLINLPNNSTVIFGDDTGNDGQQIGGFGQVINLAGTGTLNIETAGELGQINYVPGGHTLNLTGFTTINADVVRPNDATTGNLFSGLNLDGAARNLIITGGDADENDSLTLTEDLPTTISVVDFSGYQGTFTASLENGPGTDVEWVANENDFFITLGAPNPAFALFDLAAFNDAINLADAGNRDLNDVEVGDVFRLSFEVNGESYSVDVASPVDGTALFQPVPQDAFAAQEEVLEAIIGALETATGGLVTGQIQTNEDGILDDSPDTGNFVIYAIDGSTVNNLTLDIFGPNFGVSLDGGPLGITDVLGEPADPSFGVADDVPVNYNSIFEFTAAGTVAEPSSWEITNFVTAEAGNIDNYSILDLSALGITSFAQLDLNVDGGDLIITPEVANPTWEIVLVGVDNVNDVQPAENFIFA